MVCHDNCDERGGRAKPSPQKTIHHNLVDKPVGGHAHGVAHNAGMNRYYSWEGYALPNPPRRRAGSWEALPHMWTRTSLRPVVVR